MKLKIVALLLIALFAVGGAEAQTRKSGKANGFFNVGDGLPRKHWYKDPKWWAGEVVITASIAADGWTTAHRPSGIVESNKFLGTNPSDKKVAGVSLLSFGIQTTLHASAWHVTHHVPLADGSGYDQDRLGWRTFGYVGIPGEVALLYGHTAIKNQQLINKYGGKK